MSNFKNPKRPLNQSGVRKLKWWQALPLFLLMICAIATSGCQSSLQMQPSPASQVVISAELMAEPSYTERLLNFLSVKPSEQTPK